MTEIMQKGDALKAAAAKLSLCTTEQKNNALLCIAEALIEQKDEILAANDKDIAAAKQNGMSEALLDRLRLTGERINDMANGVREIIELPDPIGEVLESFIRPNGMKIQKVRVPIGVIAMIYEARPNVTTDAAAIALKTGNAILLRGSGSAICSNTALCQVMQTALQSSDLPAEAVALITDTSHDSVEQLLHDRQHIDLLIPRGGAGLISYITQNATVPVIETGVGNCHIFVDESAVEDMARKIIINAKTQRPSVCNAAETLLLHRAFTGKDKIIAALRQAGVTLYGCKECVEQYNMLPAEEKDWATEYLDLAMAVKLVDGIDAAMEHIAAYGTHHTETILTENAENAERFLKGVDAAVVNHNVSSRMTDGGVFGFGAEIGISTQKLHARGPMGLKEITSYKYYVIGNGQIR